MTTAELGHVVVVGGGLAAARSCEQLREQGHRGAITLVTAESHLPYDRPPLSKDVLRGELESTILTVDYPALGVNVRTGVRATALRPTERVLVTNGGELRYDGAILATGANPIRIPGDGEQFVLRTIDDARALRARLTSGARVLVIGTGWIGAEVATAARQNGCHVTAVEREALPLATHFGDDVGKRVLDWWEGVDLRLGAAVSRVVTGGVELVDGSMVPADVVVTGIGARPAVDWLAGSGLELDRGIVTDEWLRAAPGVVAVGDVAVWWSRRYGRRLCVEHWDDAASAPVVAVSALLSPNLVDIDPYDPIPYFWSDQLGHKLQYVGRHSDGDTLLWRERSNGSWTALWLNSYSRLTAALIADLPRENAQAQMAILRGLVLDPVQLADPDVPLSKAVSAS